jgi:hypothetical protein
LIPEFPNSFSNCMPFSFILPSRDEGFINVWRFTLKVSIIKETFCQMMEDLRKLVGYWTPNFKCYIKNNNLEERRHKGGVNEATHITVITPYSAFICIIYFPPPPPNGSTARSGPGHPHFRRFKITLRHVTRGRAPLDERSAPRRDLYLTTHNIHKRETRMPPGRIRTHNPSKRAVADPCIRPGGP